MTNEQKILAIVRDGYAQHKFFLDDGRPMSVVTIPMSVLKALGRAKLMRAIRSWKSGEQARARQAHVHALLCDGVPVAEIVELTGLTAQRIYQIKKSLTPENKTAQRRDQEDV